ncbi:filamentous hemagglutinin N-terminal domain-containing protein [Brasilonema sennae]|uniref:two-partner secretion domain-containing protein n=1 Tax=Brasilonema sennae TaxID=1397703 RepID=UPI001FE601AD|nr:S-layer family protein [Brasilonema sennae]
MRHPLFFFALPLATLASFSYLTIAKAQITPDNSLGAENSVVTPNVQINGTPSDRIDGGATRGANLFHSFQQFNINAGRGAYFSNPAGIANILTRVTGGNISNIQGVLGVLGNANLFLINPNGIIFGPNARLDMGGSFLGSTANSLIFKNGFEFSATNPQAPPLLTITAPVGLSYRENFKNITNQSRAVDNSNTPVGLTVPEGNFLTLVGGNVNLDGGRLTALGGRVELGGLSAAGTVGLNSDGSLSFPVGVQRGDVSLTNEARVDVTSGGGGSIGVNARNLDISGGSILQGGIAEGLGTVGSQAGDITLNATGDIKVVGSGDVGSGVFNNVQSNATGNGGNINITAGSFSLSDGAQVLARNDGGRGDAGKVTINASDTVTVKALQGNQQPTIASDVTGGGVGNGNDINIKARSVVLDNDAIIAASILNGKGDNGEPLQAGNVNIIAANQVFLNNRSRVYSEVGSNSVGNGGIINITAPSVSLDNNASLITRIQGGGQGRAGDIKITTGTLSVKGGAGIFAYTSGQGNAGNVSIQASAAVELVNNAYIFSTVEAGGVGNGGDIDIKAATLSLKDGAQLLTAVRQASGTQPAGRGNAGNVTVDVTGPVTIAGIKNRLSGIFSSVDTGATGDAGNITISSGSFSLSDGAQITASSAGNGAAGDIEVLARSIRLDNNSIIKADTVKGQGNITLRARDYVLLRRGSNITTNARGENVIGGNININSGVLVGFDNSDITANSTDSRGGNVKINSQGIFGFQSRNPASPNTSDITARGARPELSGNVQINVVDSNPTQGLFELTKTVIDPAQQVAQNPCIKGFGSTFTITGRGGLPTDPNKVLSSDNVRVDLIKPVPSTVSSTSATQKQPSQKPPVKQIIPAQGWIFNEKGEVVLVAYDPTKTGPQRQQPAPTSSCAAVK